MRLSEARRRAMYDVRGCVIWFMFITLTIVHSINGKKSIWGGLCNVMPCILHAICILNKSEQKLALFFCSSFLFIYDSFNLNYDFYKCNGVAVVNSV